MLHHTALIFPLSRWQDVPRTAFCLVINCLVMEELTERAQAIVEPVLDMLVCISAIQTALTPSLKNPL